jgi:hypothetical protein
LGEIVPQPQLDAAVSWLLDRIPAKIEEHDGQTRTIYGAFTPSIFRNFNGKLSPDNLRSITRRFIAAIFSPHESLGTRGAMLWELGNLAKYTPDDACEALVNMYITGASQGMPVSQNIGHLAQSAQDPMARVQIFQGDELDIQKGLVWLLANLYSRLDPAKDQEERALLFQPLLQAIDSGHEEVRRVVAFSLGLLTNVTPVQTDELNFSIMALLHDLSPKVRSAAINGVAFALREGHRVPHSTVLARITTLGTSDLTRDVRIAIAGSLSVLREAGEPVGWSVIEAGLLVDPSFEVRRLANQALARHQNAGAIDSPASITPDDSQDLGVAEA